MSIKLVATDLDGTLVDYDNSIPLENLKAIEVLNNKKIDFAICTGKTYSITKDICKKCHASYGIFGNGTQIINLKTGEEIYKNTISLSDFETCFAIAKEHHLHVHVYTADEVITTNLKYLDLRNSILARDSSGIYFKVVNSVYEYVKQHHSQIFKFVISSDTDLKKVKMQIEHRTKLNINLISKRGIYKDKIINKEYEYLDISPKNIGKGNAVHYLSQFLNVASSDVMALGDNVNDMDMLKNSGVSVALANAYDELKQVANYTTTNAVRKQWFCGSRLQIY